MLLSFQHESIYDNEFRGGAVRHDYQEDFNDDDSDYPPILLAHPPPNSRDAMPPLQFTQKDNINIVPPMTKRPPPEDVKEALGAASMTSGPVKSITFTQNGKAGLPQVPDDIREVHGSPRKTKIIGATTPRISSNPEPLSQSGELTVPSDEIEETHMHAKQREMSVLSSKLDQTLSQELITATIESEDACVKPNGAVGAIPKSMKKQPKLLRDLRRALGVQKKPNTTSVEPKRKLPTSKPKTAFKDIPIAFAKTKPVREATEHKLKQTDEHEYGKPDETVINIEVHVDKHKAHTVPIPTIDVEQYSLSTPCPSTETNLPITVADTLLHEPSHVESQTESPVSGDEQSQQQQLSLNDETRRDEQDLEAFFESTTQILADEACANKNWSEHLDLESVSTSPSKEMHNIQNQFENVQTLKSSYSIHSSQKTTETPTISDQNSSHMASIYSGVGQTMPSVESVVPVDTSPAVSETVLGTDTHAETLNDDDYSDTISSSSDSDIEISKPLPVNTDNVFGADLHESNGIRLDKSAIRPSRTTGQVQSAAMSKRLNTSYGTRNKEFVNAYNPSMDNKYTDPKIKALQRNKQERYKKEMERKKTVRLSAMSAAYGSISPSKAAKRK